MAIDLRYHGWALRTLLGRGEVGLAARIAVLDALRATGCSPKRDVRLPIRGGAVFLGADTLEIDLETLLQMYLLHIFDAACRNRVVLDIGAHKGYYGAWALTRGAREVISFEPQSQNFAFLERAQRSRRDTANWQIRRQAVGRTKGTAKLFVSQQSWSHSLFPDLVDLPDDAEPETESVEMVTLPSVLDEATAAHPGVPVILKVNVEGAAADVILPTSPADLEPVVEVHFHNEPGVHYAPEDIVAHLQAAGLTEFRQTDGLYFHVRRPGLS
jgi:FkbM family methyltransferase